MAGFYTEPASILGRCGDLPLFFAVWPTIANSCIKLAAVNAETVPTSLCST